MSDEIQPLKVKFQLTAEESLPFLALPLHGIDCSALQGSYNSGSLEQRLGRIQETLRTSSWGIYTWQGLSTSRKSLQGTYASHSYSLAIQVLSLDTC